MALLAGVTLAFPGTPLDLAWRLNPVARVQLGTLGRGIGIPFLLLGAIMVLAAYGWMQRRRWGWMLALIVFGVQAVGDLANLFMGERWKGLLGVVIVSALLAYLLSGPIRSVFEQEPAKPFEN
jgi:hypothetical protein